MDKETEEREEEEPTIFFRFRLLNGRPAACVRRGSIEIRRLSFFYFQVFQTLLLQSSREASLFWRGPDEIGCGKNQAKSRTLLSSSPSPYPLPASACIRETNIPLPLFSKLFSIGCVRKTPDVGWFVFRSSVQSIFFQLSAELYFPSFFSQLGLKRNESRTGDGSLCAINSIRIHALVQTLQLRTRS